MVVFVNLNKDKFALTPEPANTDKDGKYTIKGLSALQRTYVVKEMPTFGLNPPGSKALASAGDSLLEVKFATPGKPAATELNVTITPAAQKKAKKQATDPPQDALTIRGKVTDESTAKPVEGACIYDKVPEQFPTGTTGPDGSFEIKVARGTRQLVVKHAQGNFIPVQITRGELEGQQPSGKRFYPDAVIPLDLKGAGAVAEVQAKLRPAVSIKGHLLNPEGRPVSKGVMVCWNNLRAGASPKDFPGFLPVDVYDGEFELRHCDPNETYSVYFLDPYNGFGASVRLSPKEAGAKPVTVRLEPCGKAVVRVIGKYGEPAVGSPVLCNLATRPKDGDLEPDQIQANTLWWSGFAMPFPKTDDDGRCTLSNLIPGATYLYAGLLPGKSSQSFTVKAGESIELPDIVIAAK
jgi:hypothetical protein